MNVTSANARFWSKLGPRGTLGTVLFELATTNKSIVTVTADLGVTSGLERFRKEYPDRFFNTGIAEQNMIGLASGLATEGYIPFVTSFANFSVLRACEADRHFLSYMQRNVKLVGLSSGFAMGMFGNTHYGLEDIAIMRAFPNITILSPADTTEVAKATAAAAIHNGPVYIRLTGVMNNPLVNKDDYHFKIGEAIELRQGEHISIFATGSMVFHSIKAAEILNEMGINTGVINIHTIKPLDTTSIFKCCEGKKLIVSVEEHSKIGGLGSAIAELISSKPIHPPLLRLGTDDTFKAAGDYNYMLEQNSLLPTQIANSIASAYSNILE